MNTTTVFKSGNSQAVRIPRKYRFKDNEIAISKIGDSVILFPKNTKWANFMMGTDLFEDDFNLDNRNNLKYDNRENI